MTRYGFIDPVSLGTVSVAQALTVANVSPERASAGAWMRQALLALSEPAVVVYDSSTGTLRATTHALTAQAWLDCLDTAWCWQELAPLAGQIGRSLLWAKGTAEQWTSFDPFTEAILLRGKLTAWTLCQYHLDAFAKNGEWFAVIDQTSALVKILGSSGLESGPLALVEPAGEFIVMQLRPNEAAAGSLVFEGGAT